MILILNNDMRLLLKIVKRYYITRMSQEEIAHIEGISKSTVSRILAKAIKEQYVTFTLNFPNMSVQGLEDELIETFGLKHAVISPVEVEDDSIILHDVSESVAKYLSDIVNDNDTIAVSWGKTMNSVANSLIPSNKENISIVQLNGGVSRNIATTRAEQILASFSDNFKGTGYILPVPAFVDNKRIVEALLEDTKIREVFDLMDKARIAVLSVGNIDSNSILIQAGYFNSEDYEKMRQKGFVADICSRFLLQNGILNSDELNDRVIGIDVNKLKTKEHTICVATGKKKASGILSAITGKFINTLFTDELTAKEILRIHERQKTHKNK